MSTRDPRPGTNRPDPTPPRHPEPQGASPDGYVGPETWVREAIAEQEEHIKRWRSCMDTLGRSHTYHTVTSPAPSGRAQEGEVTYRACAGCGVTETRDDYQTHRRAGGGAAEA